MRRVAAVLTAVALLLPGGHSAAVIAATDPTPLAQWSFDEGSGSTSQDAGAHHADMALDGASWIADGHSGSALHFDGVSAGATAPDLDLHASDLTVTLWVRGDPNEPPADGAAIIEAGGRGGCDRPTWAIYARGATWAFAWYAGAPGQWYSVQAFQEAGIELWDGQWHLISVAASATDYSYVLLTTDAYPAGGTQMSPGLNYAGLADDAISLGRPVVSCDTTPAFKGAIDDIRIFPTQLTYDQVGAQLPPAPTQLALHGPSTAPAFGIGDMCYSADVTPAPGTGPVDLTVDDASGSPRIFSMDWQYRGHAAICISLHAGDYQIRADYLGSRPWLPSAGDPIDLHVTKRESTAVVGGNRPQWDNKPFAIGAHVDGHGVEATGALEVYEDVGQTRVHLGTIDLVHQGTYAGGGMTLPARPAGTYRFEVDYAGDIDHEPTTAQGSIVVSPNVAPGSVTINGGAMVTNNPIVAVDAPAAASPRSVISNSGTLWKLIDPYQPTIIGWSLVDPQYGGTPEDGVKTVSVGWYNSENELAATGTATIKLDRTPPAATGPTSSPATASRLVSALLPARLAWSGHDALSGIAHYELAQSTDGQPWSVPVLTTTTSAVGNLSSGHSYRFRVRATDLAGNVGAWAYGSTFRLTAVSQSSPSVHYRGTWANSTSTTWWEGTAKSSSAAGATARYTFTGRSIGWVSLKAANRGKAQVFVNGVLKATVDLNSATTQKQIVAWSASYSTSATRTVTIKVLGTAGRPRVDVDGFIVGS